MTNPIEQIAVLGAGSWGSTLATLLVERGHSVFLWGHDASDTENLAATRRLTVLPDLKLPAVLAISSNLTKTLLKAQLVVCAVPSQAVREVMHAARAILLPESIVISASKGLEPSTRQVLSRVIQEEIGGLANRTVVLSGPSHAEEVCRRLPTAVVASGDDKSAVSRVQRAFNAESFRVYAHADPLGVELAGALKNVYAIACGISDGLGFGDNTRAAILSRGLNEMVRIGVHQGASLLTFFGLAGVGDLAVTCTSQHSRNFQLGKKIGSGQGVDDALRSMTMVAEGYRTAEPAHELATAAGLDCPLTREIYEVLHRKKNPRQSLQDLMTRTPQSEWQGLSPEALRGLGK